MSKYQLKKTIEREIKDLNWKIDMKIVRGLSYREEARRHKLLLMQLRRLSAGDGSGLLSNIFNRIAA